MIADDMVEFRRIVEDAGCTLEFRGGLQWVFATLKYKGVVLCGTKFHEAEEDAFRELVDTIRRKDHILRWRLSGADVFCRVSFPVFKTVQELKMKIELGARIEVEDRLGEDCVFRRIQGGV